MQILIPIMSKADSLFVSKVSKETDLIFYLLGIILVAIVGAVGAYFSNSKILKNTEEKLDIKLSNHIDNVKGIVKNFNLSNSAQFEVVMQDIDDLKEYIDQKLKENNSAIKSIVRSRKASEKLEYDYSEMISSIDNDKTCCLVTCIAEQFIPLFKELVSVDFVNAITYQALRAKVNSRYASISNFVEKEFGVYFLKIFKKKTSVFISDLLDDMKPIFDKRTEEYKYNNKVFALQNSFGRFLHRFSICGIIQVNKYLEKTANAENRVKE